MRIVIPLAAAAVVACGIAAGFPSGSADAQPPVEHNYWDSPGMLRTVLRPDRGPGDGLTGPLISAVGGIRGAAAETRPAP